MAAGSHPFPFRTRKLSPPAPMVLGERSPGRVGRRRISPEKAPASAGAFRVLSGLRSARWPPAHEIDGARPKRASGWPARQAPGGAANEGCAGQAGDADQAAASRPDRATGGAASPSGQPAAATKRSGPPEPARREVDPALARAHRAARRPADARSRPSRMGRRRPAGARTRSAAKRNRAAARAAPRPQAGWRDPERAGPSASSAWPEGRLRAAPGRRRRGGVDRPRRSALRSQQRGRPRRAPSAARGTAAADEPRRTGTRRRRPSPNAAVGRSPRTPRRRPRRFSKPGCGTPPAPTSASATRTPSASSARSPSGFPAPPPSGSSTASRSTAWAGGRKRSRSSRRSAR